MTWVRSFGRAAAVGWIGVISTIPAHTAALSRAQSEVLYGDYGALLDRGQAEAFAARLLEASAGAQADQEIALAGACLAVRAGCAADVLDSLTRRQSAEAATLRGELLHWLARGDDRPWWARKNASERPELMSTEALGQRAGELLDHPDPFVSGLAEWALAIRLHNEFECAEERVQGRRRAVPWPPPQTTGWYGRWLGIPDQGLVELDYVRQTVARGQHRTAGLLLTAAQEAVARLAPLQERIQAEHDPNPAESTELRGRVAQAFEELRAAASAQPLDLTAVRRRFLNLRLRLREAILSNQGLDFDSIVFVTRHATPTSGNITAGRWNVHTPGGDIVVKRGLEPDSPGEPLLRGRLGPGHVRGLDLHWDAGRVVFAFAPQPHMGGEVAEESARRVNSDFGGYFGLGVGAVEEMSHLFEMQVDGTGLRQLTNDPQHADQEPVYLPNDDIVFVSDRSWFGSQCAGALEQDNLILNLFRCDPDGGRVRALSNNKDFDRHPHLMDTGQLLFLHWEYQERHLWQTHTLWTCRPDGSQTDALYKQHIDSGPMSLREARQVAGHRKVVAIACGHHNWDQGAIFMADYAQGINDPRAMRNVTPGVSGTEGGYGGAESVEEGGVQDGGGHYMFPYPLSDRSFLAAYSYKRPEHSAGQNFALYYLDVWGNKELIHRDRQLSVAWLMPLRRTVRPPVLPELRQEPLVDAGTHPALDAPPSIPPPVPPERSAPPRDDSTPIVLSEERWANAIVSDVHADMPGVPRGTIKYLRIAQKVPWPCVPDETKACGFNDLHWMPAAWEPVLGLWDWGAARVIGTVPVESDGSAHFQVPADQTVYFQALDQDYLEVRRMRSNVTFVAGEVRACVGCHETKAAAPPFLRHAPPLALQRAPSRPVPPPWGDRVIPDFERDLQPIFNRHCLRCHGEEEPAGGIEFTDRRVDGYLQSYRSLFGLRPEDSTPFAGGYWSIWHPERPALRPEAAAEAKTRLRRMLLEPQPGQLLRLADYMGGPEVTLPRAFGSGRSRLALHLLNDPAHRKEVQFTSDEWIALVTWIDLNAQYWGTFVEKDAHYASRREARESTPVVPPRRVQAIFPDPWQRPPAGEWYWVDNSTVALRP